MKFWRLVGLLAGSTILLGTSVAALEGFWSDENLADSVIDIKAPAIQKPQWLVEKEAAAAAARVSAQRQTTSGKLVVTYSVETRGAVGANLAEFKSQSLQTLNDQRGWSRLNVVFQEVSSGGQFTLVLSEASQVPSFSSMCSSEYSCRVGRFVIINQDRWLGATPSWNQAGGSLRDYRHMVINHEVGHWLGHGHTHCGGASQPAPVMQQQSMNLEGCRFNPWPLNHELYAPNLGR